MKNAVIIILVNFLSSSLSSQTWTRVEDAAEHNGEIVNLFGLISDIRFVNDGTKSSTFLIMRQKNSYRFLSVILPKAADKNIDDLRSTYLDQYVQVRGKLEVLNGSTQIVLNSRKQIAIAKEDHRIHFGEPE